VQLDARQRLRNLVGHKLFVKPKFLQHDCGVLSICFDDFPRSAWKVAGPLLAEHDASATYFVSGAYCGQTYMGIEQFKETDLFEIQQAGHEIGCHTFDHYSALKVPIVEFERSIQKNRQFLQERLKGEPVESFAFPYNHVSLRSKIAVARHFRAARAVGVGVNPSWIDLSEIAGVNLSLTEVGGYAADRSGLLDINKLIAQAAQQRKWLVVYTHDVSDRPSEHGCTVRGLESLLIQARQNGLAIKSIKEVIAS
jgi:peptidoglycan/xylan/chitin deacetylase (PgdA/CDA1 family)